MIYEELQIQTCLCGPVGPHFVGSKGCLYATEESVARIDNCIRIRQPKRADPKAVAAAGKSPMHLLPLNVLVGVAWVLETGAKKYGAWNWRKSEHIKASVYIGAALRHIAQYQTGVDVDAESSMHPLDHAIASLLILRDADLGKKLDDDRVPG